MATQVQFRGGSSTEHNSFTGAAREVTVDTTKNTVVVHDGSTAGGHALAKENDPNFTGSVTIGESNSAQTFDLSVRANEPTIMIRGNNQNAPASVKFLPRDSSTSNRHMSIAGVGQALTFNIASSSNNQTVVERMRLNDSGSLLIGGTASSPNIELKNDGTIEAVHVESPTGRFTGATDSVSLQLPVGASTNPCLAIGSGSRGLKITTFDTGISNAGVDFDAFNTGQGELRFSTKSIERVRITKSGDITLTNAVTGGSWDGTGGTGTGYFVTENGGIYVRRDSSAGDSNNYFAAYRGDSTEVFEVTGTGSIYSAGIIRIGDGAPSDTGKLSIKGAPYAVTNSGKALGGIDLTTSSGVATGAYSAGISFGTTTFNGRAAISGVMGTGSNDGDVQGLAFFTHSASTGSADAVERMRLIPSGKLVIGGTLDSAPNIELKGSDGSITTAGSINVGDVDTDETDHRGVNLTLSSDGAKVSVQHKSTANGSNVVFQAHKGTDQTSFIKLNGDSRFAGSVDIGGTSSDPNVVIPGVSTANFDCTSPAIFRGTSSSFTEGDRDSYYANSGLYVMNSDNSAITTGSFIRFGTRGTAGYVTSWFAGAVHEVANATNANTNGSSFCISQLTQNSTETVTKRLKIERTGEVHIPGGLRLGDNDAAHEIDEYEEGTWTPIYVTGGSQSDITYGSQQGYYTRIGDLVTINCYVRTNALSNQTGTVRIGGLPLAPVNVGSEPEFFGRGIVLSTSSGAQPLYVVASGDNFSTQLYLYTTDDHSTLLQASSLDAGSNKNRTRLSLTYRTSA